MGSVLKFFLISCGLGFTGTVLYLLVKRKISERNSFFWLLGSFGVLVLSAAPKILEILADAVGIDYPPALLFLLSTLILLIITLHQSIQISVLNDQLKELTQHVAINKLDMELNSRDASGSYSSDFNKKQVEDHLRV